MSRNTRFHPSHEPFCTSSHLQLQNQHISGPFSFLNPTTAPYIHTGISKPVDPTDDLHSKSPDRFPDSEKAPRSKKEQGASDIHFQWRSRDNRKGRHALSVEPDGSPDAKYLTPKSTSSFTEVLKGIGRMFMQYPYWDISYLVAIMFALGSVVWVINAFFVWLPLVDPSTKFPGETGKAGGITAFIGATIFEIGSVFLMFEAVNENQPGCFGWALERALEGGKMQVRADKEECSHHHRNRKNLVGKSDGELSPLIRPSYLHSAKEKTVKHSTLSPSSTASDFSQDQSPAQSSDAHGREWQWFPSWHDLTTHYVRELGFLACSAQFLGATIFWISGFTALPGIANKLTSQGLLDGVYWVPQIVGGTGFIVSG